MADVFNWNKFQIPHTGVDSSTLGESVQTRDLHMRMSNFGALNVGARMDDDYSRTTLYFQSKDELMNPSGWDQDADMNDNPLLEGSSLKYTRDDQFIRMTMDSSTGTFIDQPKADVMDQNVIDAAGMEKPRNYPTEGWHSFGKKYDKPIPYVGW